MDTFSDAQTRARRLAASLSAGERADVGAHGPADAVPDKGPAMKVTRLPLRDTDLRQLADALARWYRSQHLEAQVTTDETGARVQCRSHSARAVAGAALALTVVLRQDRDELAVEIGAGRWVDKGVAAGVGLLTLSAGVGLIPLASSVWGGWQQARLPARTLEFIQATAPTYARREPPERSRVPAPPSPTGPGAAPSPQAGADPLRRVERPRTPVDVNTASAQELRDRAGLPQRAADRLVTERSRRHGFSDLGEVQAVLRDHLQPHELAQARQHLRLTTPTHRDRPPTTGADGGRRVLDLDIPPPGTR